MVSLTCIKRLKRNLGAVELAGDVEMMEAAVTLFFPVLMAYSACSDLFTMTISNRISVALVVVFPILALALGAPFTLILWHLSCGAGMLCIVLFFFSMGWIGGGDAKLATATAVWLGWEKVLEYGLIATVLGGGLTLALIAVRKWPLPAFLLRHPWIARLHDEKSGIPYGIALAAAGLLIYPQTLVWLQAIGV